MRRQSRTFRFFRLPQTLVVAVCLLIVFISLTPVGARPALAIRDAQHWLRPATETDSTPVPHFTFAKQVIPEKIDCHAHPCIALSFDDGPNRPTTSRLLDTLEKEQVHATFFVVGKRIAGQEDLLRRMQKDGDEVGNHSWSHPDFATLSKSEITDQIARTQAAIEAAGLPAPTLFRPPYGSLNGKLARSLHVQVALWNEDPDDWMTRNAKDVEKSVLKYARPGGVVEMHDIYDSTAAAMPQIIKELKHRHYQFVTVSELLKTHSHSSGLPFYGYEPSLFSNDKHK